MKKRSIRCCITVIYNNIKTLLCNKKYKNKLNLEYKKNNEILNILHISDVKELKANGVAAVVPNYVISQSLYANTALYDLNNNYFLNEKYKYYSMSNYKTIYELPTPFNRPDLVVFHEVYKSEYLKLYKECLKNNIPYVIIPHGCLTKFALKQKWLKKKIANFLFFNKFVKYSRMLQFLSTCEEEQSKVIHSNKMIFANGIYLPKEKILNKPQNKNLIYIGRYSIYQKGLDILVNTCEKMQDWMRKQEFVVNLYGKGEQSEKNRLIQIINKAKISDLIIVHDGVYGQEKIDILLSSYAFIQLSRAEGLPQGIAEALSYGVPCIVSYETAFYDYVKKNKCGLAVDSNNIMATIDQIKKLYNDPKMREMMSKNAATAVYCDFSWDQIAKEIISKYEELVGIKG